MYTSEKIRIHNTVRTVRHTASVLNMDKGDYRGKKKRHKGPYVSSGQLASLLASNGHNKMLLL